MPTTFHGKQPGYPDPTLAHDQDPPAPCAEAIVWAGKQSGYADPTSPGCIPMTPEQKAEAGAWT
jgi:hypothetical protein